MSTPNNSKIRFNENVVDINNGTGGAIESLLHSTVDKLGVSAASSNNTCGKKSGGCGCNNANNSEDTENSNCNCNSNCCCSNNNNSKENHQNNQRIRETKKKSSHHLHSHSEDDCNETNTITRENIVSSIPKDIMEKIKDWKVKSTFITKGASLVATSKQHKFKQPVSFEEAISFLVDSSVKDSTLIFTNDNSLIFADGIYNDLDLIDDDDE